MASADAHFQCEYEPFATNMWCNVFDSRVTAVDDNVDLGSQMTLGHNQMSEYAPVLSDYYISAFYG